MCQFGYKVYDALAFFYQSRLELDIKLAQVNSPLVQSTSYFRLLENLSKWLVSQDDDGMSLQLRTKFTC